LKKCLKFQNNNRYRLKKQYCQYIFDIVKEKTLNWQKKHETIIMVCIGIIMVSSTTLLASSKNDFQINQFINPETCKECHYEIFEQWENSMHNLAHKDPVYNKISQFLRKGLTDKQEILEAETCVKCHTPVGYVTGFPKKISDDLSKTPSIATLGIQCDYCHSAEKIKQMYNNGLMLKPGFGEDDPGVKQGPFDDSEPDFHEAAFSKMHTDSTICGTCHDVKHVAFGTDLETTYTEWKNSPYNSSDPAKKIACQGCHMYQRPGIPATGSTPRPENPGSATDDSKIRPHIFTHYFIGANTAVPEIFAGQNKAAMAVERLQNAADLTVDTSRLEQNKLDITVINSGAGHSIPTGVGDLRQVWLEITIKDKDKKTVFQQGGLDKNHELDCNTIMFRTVFGDENGNEVINLAKARQVIKDTRIKAKQSVVKTIDIVKTPEKGSKLIVRLLYRGISPKIFKMIPGEQFKPLPVIEMEKIEISL
jgi:hypothetical protein